MVQKISRKPGNTKLISIVITAYNIEEYIGEAIESAIRQTYENIEIIIVNDCSSDKTPEIISQFDDDRIKVITNVSNKGIGYSKYIGGVNSTGDYIMFLDGDDYIDSNIIMEYVKAIEENPDTNLIGSNVYKENVSGKLTDNYFTCMNSLMMSRKLFEDCDYSQMRYMEELDNEGRIKKYAVNPIHINKILYHYRKHDKSATRQRIYGRSRICNAITILKNFEDCPDYGRKWALKIMENEITKMDITKCPEYKIEWAQIRQFIDENKEKYN